MADIYYVNNATGNDDYSGMSTSEPFQTIQKAANVVGPGDTVNVMDGGKTYYEVVTISTPGLSGNVITFQNYSGDSPTVDGEATDSGAGLPTAGNFTLFNPSRTAWENGNGVSRAKGSGGLVKIRASYVHWDGINVRGSLSRGVVVYNGAQYVQVKNCTIGPNYAHGILFLENVRNSTIDNCEVKESGAYYPARRAPTQETDWCTAIGFQNSHYNTIKNCKVFNNWGEATIIDTNWGASSNNTIEDSYYWDNFQSCYIHGSTYITVQRCMFFRTAQEKVQDKYISSLVPGIVAGSVENRKYPDRDKGGKNLTFINNIFVNLPEGLRIKGSVNRDAMKDCLFANNTAVNCDIGYRLSVVNKSNMVFKNNISYNNTTEISDGTAGYTQVASGWTFDYNHWESSVHANVTGANDVTGDPSLVDHTYSITGSGTNANYDATRYRIASGSTAIDAADDLSGTFTTDYNSDTRVGWDIGAFEYDGNSSPTATNSPSPSSGNAPLSVTFTGGPGSMSSYSWTLHKVGSSGDPVVFSTSQSPSYTFNDVGVYTVVLTVTDSNGLKDSASTTITVQATSSASAPLVVEQVVFDEGATSYAVTAATAPKAALYYYSGAATNGAAANDALFGIGLAAGTDLATDYAFGMFAEHAQSVTDTARQAVSTAALFFPNANGDAVSSATVTSATSSSVGLSWTGTSNSEKIVGLNFSGNAITNQSIELVEPKVENGTHTINGDWNLAIMPFLAHALDNNIGAASMSFGFAKKGGNQVCTTYHNRLNQTTTEIRSGTYDDRIAHTYRYNYGLQISSWTNSSITFKTIDNDGTAITAPVLLMKIDSAYNFDVEIEETPTATGNNDYTTNYGYDPQIVLGILTNHATVNTEYSDSNAGVFGIHSANSTVDRTAAITSVDGASVSDEQSWTDAEWDQLDEDTAVIGTGTMSTITNGFRINIPSTAHTTAYKMPVLVIEDTSAGTGAVATFTHDADADTTTNDTVNFYDTSDGATSWAWDFGDSSGTSTSQDPTYSYSDAGTYTVQLDINGGGGLLTTTDDLTINSPGITIGYSISPTSGSYPLTLTLDASSSTSETAEDIDNNRTRWRLYKREGDEYTEYIAIGTETTVVINEPGTYSLYLEMFTTEALGTASVLEVADVVDVSTDYLLTFQAQDGQVTTEGPYQAIFSPQASHPLVQSATFAWDYGDGNTASTTGPVDATNTYSTVTTTTAYDVQLIATYPDGDTDTVTRNDYITLVPSSSAPRTVDQMITREAALDLLATDVKEHIGIIEGTWTVNATYSNVYEITLSRFWANGLDLRVYEDGEPLSEQSSVANVNSNAGSFYTSFSDPNLTIYVRTTNTDDPTSNGSNYHFRHNLYDMKVREVVQIGESVTMFLLSIDPSENVSVDESVTISIV